MHAIAVPAMLSAGLTASAAFTFPSEVAPANNSTLLQFNGVNLKYQKITEISDITFKGEPKYTYVNNAIDGATPVAGHKLNIATTRDKSGVRVYFPNEVADSLLDVGEWPIVAPGKYHVELPAMTITDISGATYDVFAAKYDYQVIPAASYSVDPNPANELFSLKGAYIIAFPDFETVQRSNDFSLTITNPEGSELETIIGTSNNQLSFSPAYEQTTGGQYQVTLKAGSLILSGGERAPQLSPEIAFTLTVTRSADGKQYHSLVPADGSVIDKFSTVSMKFESVPHVNRACTATAKLYIDDVLAAELPNTAWGVQFAVENDDPTFASFTFTQGSDFFVDGGAYRVEIPEGFMLLGHGENMYPINAITLNYTVPRKFAYTIDPVPGSYESLETFTITYDEVKEIRINELQADEEGNGVIQLVVMGVADNHLPTSITAEGNKVTMTFPKCVDPATYVLSLPSGAFSFVATDNTEHTSVACDITYYIDNFPKPTVMPAEGEYTSLGDITITLADCCTFASWIPSQKFALWKDNGNGQPEGDAIGFWSRPAGTDYKGSHSITLTPDQAYVLPDGKYVWGVNRRSAFSVNCSGTHPGGYNQGGILYRFEIKNDTNGIHTIGTTDRVTVYNSAGILIMRDAEASQLLTLPRGLYIINGKKTVL